MFKFYRVNKSSSFMAAWLGGKKKNDDNVDNQMRKKPKN